MSKIISISSLSEIREQIRKDDFNANVESFFENIELEDAYDFPVVSDNFINLFYNQFNNYPTDDFNLARILYEHLPLSSHQASNNLFWVYLNLQPFSDYIKKRWESRLINDSGETDVTEFEKHFLALEPSQNSLIQSPLAGLWWAIHLTFNEELDDKYFYSKILLSDRNLRVKNIGTHQIVRDRKTLYSILEFYEKNKNAKYRSERIGSEAIAQQTTKLLNQYGGLSVLSFLSREEIASVLENNKEVIFRRAYKVKVGKKKSRERIQQEKLNSENDVQEKTPVVTYDHYFCLDGKTGSYKVTSKPESDWAYCIGLDFQLVNQFLIHFYKEGKIKKSLVNGNLSNKTIDREKPYSNGKCPNLNLCDVQLISEPVLFGIAYKTRTGVFFKAMDEQDIGLFRIDNGNLRQEGKKVLYFNEPFQLSYKILPYDLKYALGTLVPKSPTATGANITNTYHQERWSALEPHWPELFDGTINWCNE